ncbi:MAG TPA: hypothetical protein VLM37_04175, partial [Fibrobacteraceae bacterium]|nr:hypothetical protein [Fibrobacteraceae bacterium]
SWYKPLWRYLLFQPRLLVQYSQWKYNSSEDRISWQWETGGGFALNYPLTIGANIDTTGHLASGNALLLGIGLEAFWCPQEYRWIEDINAQTSISQDSAQEYSIRNSHYTWGPSILLQFFVTKIPLAVSFSYSYFSDGFGDMRVQIGTPIPFLPRIPGGA